MSTSETVAAVPASVNLVCYHGDSWQQTFRFLADGQPIDLTGLVVQAEVRGTTGHDSNLVTSVDAAAGTIQISLPPGGLPVDLYDYDVEVDDGGTVTTWVRGRLRVERDVTNEQP